MRLIDSDTVLLIIEDIKLNKDIPKNYGTLLDIERKIRKLPTIDAEPVVHAHWIENYKNCFAERYYKCSKCQREIKVVTGEKTLLDFPYCHCGAKMDEEQ